LVEGEVRQDGDVIKVLASSVAPLDVALTNGNGQVADRIEVKLADGAVAQDLEDLLGVQPGSSVRVRLVVPLDGQGEVTIDLGDDHRLALMRRPDLERRSGVLRVVDL
jgi:hypothetical protein